MSFAYAIGMGLAAADGLSVGGVVVPLLVGGVYAIVLSAVQRLLRTPLVDEQPESWSGLVARARSRIDAALIRHAIALALAGGIAMVIVPFTNQSNGAWLVTGALIVLKPGYDTTLQTAMTRAVGTVGGALLAGSLAALTSSTWVLLLAALLLTWLAEALVRRSFGLFVVFITPLSVLLTNVLVPGDWQVAVLRTADVAAGSAIAIVVALIVLRPIRHRDVELGAASA